MLAEKYIINVKPSSWSRPLVSEFRLLRVASGGTRCMFQSLTHRAVSNPRSIPPQTLVHRTSKAGLPSRSTGKRPRCWARSRDFRFASSYLVTVMRPIRFYDTCYVTTAAYIPARITRVTLCHYSISMCDGGRCLSLSDIPCKITVLDVAKDIGRNYANGRF